MTNLSTKFEVSVFTYYEDIKSNAKCRNWTSLGLGLHKVTGNVCILYSTYEVLFDFNRNYVSIVLFSSYNELFVKSRLF